jgi:glycosyltransferase involved in cell wall biosynthesis
MKDISVLMMTCDKYSDIWQPFYQLYTKYFPNPYDLYVGTETLDCDFGTTIKTQGQWTNRLKETLKQIDTKYVLFLLDDFFIRNKVNYVQIDTIKDYFKDNIATFNFELTNCIRTEEKSIGTFKKKSNKQIYLFSCQPGLWDREKLIEILDDDKSPWQMETTELDSKYEFYANVGELIIDIGYYNHKKSWGVVQGKWATEMIKLNNKEKLGIDFSQRGFYDLELSIITPFYKTYDYTMKLYEVLKPQLNNNVEWIIVDDGTNEKKLDKLACDNIHIIHKRNGGVSSARNKALRVAQGNYIAFIDSDDLVKDYYVSKILNKIKETRFDYCYMSWEFFNKKTGQVIIKDVPPLDNTSVWNCVYKREKIGKHRFNEDIQYGEEIDFNLKVRSGYKENITDVMYLYNFDREDSATELYRLGKLDKYKPIKAQIVMFLKYVSKIGGVETFLYEFFKLFSKTHDIQFLYEDADPQQLQRYREFVKCRLYRGEPVNCETYINVNHTKNIADNVIASSGNYLDMVHTDYQAMGWKTYNHPKTTMNICVSEVGRKALLMQFPKAPTEVIHNLINLPDKIEKQQLTKNRDDDLVLVSATRLSWEKGYTRMKEMAKRMNRLGKHFIWYVFTNDVPDEDIPNFIFMKSTYEVNNFVASADYYVVLSNTECCSMSNGSALGMGIPIISTNYPSIYEQGFVNGKTGYIVELDLSNLDKVIEQMFDKIPKYKPIIPDNISAWHKWLGKETISNYEFDGEEVDDKLEDKWVALVRIRDEKRNFIEPGEEPYLVSSERIRVLLDNNMIKRKEE